MAFNINLKQTVLRAFERVAQILLDPEQRSFWLAIVIAAFGIQLKPLLIMTFVVVYYFALKKRYGVLENASLGELMLAFIPASLLYLTTWFCLIYGYIHTLHLSSGMGFAQAKPLMILMVFIAGFYFTFNKRHRNLVSLNSLILDFIPGLLYLTIWSCLMCGYAYTLRVPTDIGFLYGHGSWAAVNFDLIFKNSPAVVKLFTKSLTNVTVGEICTIIVPTVVFVVFQRFLMSYSAQALAKKLSRMRKVK